MGQIENKVIGKVYEGKDYEKDGKVIGRFYNFYLVGGKKKFGLFVGKGKTPPSDGQRVAMMEWETKEQDGYENNKVTKIVYQGASEVAPKGDVCLNKNDPIWFCLSYAKDIQVARMGRSIAPDITLKEICLEVVDAALAMISQIGSPQEPKKDPIDKALAEVDDSEIPF